MKNTRVLLASRPAGLPARDNWTIETVDTEPPGEGEFLAEVLYVSLDPAMRGWIKEGKSYIDPVEIGAVMRAGGVGRVVESRHPDYAAGDHVLGITGVQGYWRSDGRGVAPRASAWKKNVPSSRSQISPHLVAITAWSRRPARALPMRPRRR